MRAWLVAVGLVGLALVSAAHLRVWRDDLTLWTDATSVVETPRASLNLSRALLFAHRFDEAAAWQRTAMAQAAGTPRADIVRLLVHHQLVWMTANGSGICDRPPWRSWCAR